MFWSRLFGQKIRGHETGRGRTSPLESRECAFWEPFLGHADHVETQLIPKLAEHSVFLQRIPLVADVQSAWSLFLHCAGGRAKLFAQGGEARIRG